MTTALEDKTGRWFSMAAEGSGGGRQPPPFALEVAAAAVVVIVRVGSLAATAADAVVVVVHTLPSSRQNVALAGGDTAGGCLEGCPTFLCRNGGESRGGGLPHLSVSKRGGEGLPSGGGGKRQPPSKTSVCARVREWRKVVGVANNTHPQKRAYLLSFQGRCGG